MEDEDDEKRRYLFGKAKANMESSLLPIGALEREHFRSIRLELGHLLWCKAHRLDYSIFFILEIYGREIVRFPFPSFVLEYSL